MSITVHVTHEAVHKVGGIGAVLQGLITAAPYQQATQRTILVGPLHDRHRKDPLGPDGTVLYDNWNGTWEHDIGTHLYDIETRRGVRLVYGRRPFKCADGSIVEPEVLLVDVEGAAPSGLAQFKFALFQRFGLTSDRYESHWEFEQYMRLAEPAYEALQALLADRGDTPVHMIAHEFMGLPTALRAILAGDRGIFTVFYAHEVATARRLVEEIGDEPFYRALREAEPGAYLDDLFGPQDSFFKHALVRLAWHCDAVFAVGDLVVDELRALGPEFADIDIDRVYNGVPVAACLEAGEREAARTRLAGVADQWLGWTPDILLTHVGRLVPSKGFWRDLEVLDALDVELGEQGRTAVLLILATEAGPRLGVSVAQMRSDYGWPLAHREGFPDLSPGELVLDLQVRAFNARSRHSKVVFVNQFGFDSESTGGAVPEGVGFSDLRAGSDAELGLSTYEPFGIAQIEPLAFGGLPVISDACGCLGFLRQVAGDSPSLFVTGDYTHAVGDAATGSHAVSAAVASRVAAALPANAQERAKRLLQGYEVAQKMSWNQVCETQYLPALRRMEQRRT